MKKIKSNVESGLRFIRSMKPNIILIEWIRTVNIILIYVLERKPSGAYKNPLVHAAWLGWQGTWDNDYYKQRHEELYTALLEAKEFIESITDALGPYQYLDGTQIIIDARKELQKIEKVAPDLMESFEDVLCDSDNFKPIPDYADIFTLEDFKENCECGGFIDYDGTGYYVKNNVESNIIARPSDFKKGKIKKGYTHVAWYNK